MKYRIKIAVMLNTMKTPMAILVRITNLNIISLIWLFMNTNSFISSISQTSKLFLMQSLMNRGFNLFISSKIFINVNNNKINRNLLKIIENCHQK